MSISSIITLTAGSVLVMWMSELITEKGIGNGGSLIIFVGIISGIPLYSSRTAQMVSNDSALMWGLILLLTIFFITMVFIVIMQEAVRKVIIVNPKRQVGNKVYGGVNTFIPFKLNPGGVMPIIFAVAILLFPSTILSLVGQANLPAGHLQDIIMVLNKIFNPSGLTYYAIYFLMIVALTFFYASIMPNMQPKEIADNLKKQGGVIPGIRSGKPTSDYLSDMLGYIIFIGAVGLSICAFIPIFFNGVFNASVSFAGTSIIIIVGVIVETMKQIESQMLVRHYTGFLSK